MLDMLNRCLLSWDDQVGPRRIPLQMPVRDVLYQYMDPVMERVPPALSPCKLHGSHVVHLRERYMLTSQNIRIWCNMYYGSTIRNGSLIHPWPYIISFFHCQCAKCLMSDASIWSTHVACVLLIISDKISQFSDIHLLRLPHGNWSLDGFCASCCLLFIASRSGERMFVSSLRVVIPVHTCVATQHNYPIYPHPRLVDISTCVPDLCAVTIPHS